ncbi:hypothetical protein [uncultured Robinsoniella sp.]|uniref:hypothetical protein n=1 Tax=uncultured Robinsoniella sp. TaxID=904190 RepID=UPI00374F8C99
MIEILYMSYPDCHPDSSFFTVMGDIKELCQYNRGCRLHYNCCKSGSCGRL